MFHNPYICKLLAGVNNEICESYCILNNDTDISWNPVEQPVLPSHRDHIMVTLWMKFNGIKKRGMFLILWQLQRLNVKHSIFLMRGFWLWKQCPIRPPSFQGQHCHLFERKNGGRLIFYVLFHDGIPVFHSGFRWEMFLGVFFFFALQLLKWLAWWWSHICVYFKCCDQSITVNK